MGFLSLSKTALALLCKGEWRELSIRTLIALKRLDLETVNGWELGLPPESGNPYSDSGRADLQRVLVALGIGENDAIVDFGCGKGGALITFADFPFSKITGVEISRQLLLVARKNLQLLKMNHIDLVCCDAKDFVNLEEYNYFYFFNPFPCSVMKDVLGNIKKSIRRKERKVTIIYLNPVCHSLIMDDGFFGKSSEYGHFDHQFFVYTHE